MNENNQSNEDIMVSCDECQKEIPKSLAMVVEAEEYIRYYCGPDCFDKSEKSTK